MTRPIKLLLLSLVLILLFGGAWAYAARGWGYAGYGTRRHDDGRYYGMHGPSIFYFGGASYYPTGNLRRDGVGGPGSTGRGPGMGK
jgi:hypothetical protein